MSSRIFISYRRSDSSDFVAHISEKLKTRFGEENVFIDFADIPPGTKWLKYLEREIIGCDVFIVMIGSQWLQIMRDKARNNQPDIVRREIELALAYEKIIVPVCIKGAQIPKEKQLPPKLRPLLDFNIATLNSGNNLEHEFERIAEFLATEVPDLQLLKTSEEQNTVQPSQQISGSGNVTFGGNMTGGEINVYPENKKRDRIDQLEHKNRQLKNEIQGLDNQLTRLRRDERIEGEVDLEESSRNRKIRNLIVTFIILLVTLIIIAIANVIIGIIFGAIAFGVYLFTQVINQPQKGHDLLDSDNVKRLEREKAKIKIQIQQNEQEIRHLYDEVNGG